MSHALPPALPHALPHAPARTPPIGRAPAADRWPVAVVRRTAHRLLLAGVLALCAAPARAETYTVLCMTTPCGHLRTVEQGTTLETDYHYRDNGRGPDQKEWLVFDTQGRLRSYRTEGVSTYGARISERFERADDGRVSWTSRVDRAAPVAAPGDAPYLPLEFSPAYLEHVARLLLAGTPTPALPAGTLRLERVRVESLLGEPVGLYALHGFDLMPQHLWLRERDHRLVAQVWPGYGGTVLAGFETAQATMEQRQREAGDAHLRQLAERLRIPLPGLTVIQAVRWFDARGARLRGPSDIFVRDGRIAAIETPRPAAALAALGIARRIDGSGRTLLPGLVDMHAHVEPSQGLLDIAAGVTAVRDVGNSHEQLWKTRERIERGELIGPRIAANGFIEGKSPFSSQADFVPDTLDGARAAIDWYAAHGYRQLKLYNSIRPEWVRPMAAHAARRGLRVGGHVPAFMTAAEAVRSGFRELHHINQVTLNFLVGPTDDTRTLLRFTLPGEKAADLRLDDRRTRDFIALLRRTGTVVDPTAVAFEAMYLQRHGQTSPSFTAVADHLPPSMQRLLKLGEMEVGDREAARYAASWTVMMALTRRLHAAGVPLVAGTDSIPGFAMHRELELYAEAGIPVPEVLRIATWNGARFSDRQHEIGSIERGKRADLVLVDGNPLQRLSDIRRVALVIQGDTAYAPEALHAAMGIRPFVPAARLDPP
jgi:hypothetical protein